MDYILQSISTADIVFATVSMFAFITLGLASASEYSEAARGLRALELQLKEVSAKADLQEGRLNSQKVYLVESLEERDEAREALLKRVERLEAKHRNGGKELVRRARKVKRGSRIVNAEIAPNVKSPKDMVFNMSGKKGVKHANKSANR